jgi:WD40 repeat protein
MRTWTASGVQREWPFDAASPRGAAWSPDGERVAIGTQGGLVRLWTAQDGQPQDTLGAASYGRSVLFSTGGQRLSLTPKLADSLLYVVESDDGSWCTLTVAEFDELARQATTK